MDTAVRQALTLLVLVNFSAALKKCENSGGESECGQQVVHAMVQGFAEHPEKFIGLTVHSSYSEFQAYFHNVGMHGCPRPCLPQEEKCVKFGPDYPGMSAVNWVRNDGMRNHPQWFPELSSDSSDLDIAKVLYMHGNKETPRVCLKDEEEGHFVAAEQWDDGAKNEKEKDEEAIEKQKPEKEFFNCGTHGISFTLLDAVGQLPVTKSSSFACQTYCAHQKAIYFAFYEPTQTCHCPPKSSEMEKSIEQSSIGGKVHCARDMYIKKWPATDDTSVAAVYAPSRPSLLMLFSAAAAALMAVSAIVAASRTGWFKVAQSVVPCSVGEAESDKRERVLMLQKTGRDEDQAVLAP